METQADVDNFKTTSINTIDGNLTIGTDEGEDILNLDGLSNLTTVTHAIIVKPSYKGVDLAGLESLEYAGSIKLGTLSKLASNKTLKRVALPALKEITGDLILRNAALKTIDLPELVSVGEEFNITSDSITSVNINNLSDIGDDLTIVGSIGTSANSDMEAIVFTQLKQVGGNINLRYLKGLLSVYFPELNNIGGMTTIEFCSNLGGLVFPEIVSAGGFSLSDCSLLSDFQTPKMKESGAIIIERCTNLCNMDCAKVSVVDGDIFLRRVNIPDLKCFTSLETVNGTLTLYDLQNVDDFTALSNLKSVRGLTIYGTSIRDVDISGIEFNGGLFKITNDKALASVTAQETFNGSAYIYGTSGATSDVFEIHGFSVVKGDFDISDFHIITTLTIPVKIIEGNANIGVSWSSSALIQNIDVPYLEEVNGTLSIKDPAKAESYSFGRLTRVGKNLNISCNTTASICTISLPKLRTIGDAFEEGDNTLSTWLIGGGEAHSFPELSTVNGGLSIKTGSNTYYKANSFACPKLKKINGALNIEPQAASSRYRDNTLTSLDFSSLEQVESITIQSRAVLTDFSSFATIFEKGGITDAANWSVTDCGYNPTFEDMQAGRYTKP